MLWPHQNGYPIWLVWVRLLLHFEIAWDVRISLIFAPLQSMTWLSYSMENHNLSISRWYPTIWLRFLSLSYVACEYCDDNNPMCLKYKCVGYLFLPSSTIKEFARSVIVWYKFNNTRKCSDAHNVPAPTYSDTMIMIMILHLLLIYSTSPAFQHQYTTPLFRRPFILTPSFSTSKNPMFPCVALCSTTQKFGHPLRYETLIFCPPIPLVMMPRCSDIPSIGAFLKLIIISLTIS